jgi:PadR family transcriptional regulator, regulatory protein PadR
MKNLAVEKPLGDLEQAVLVAVVALGGKAYGVSVQSEVKARTGRDLSTGAIYSVLARLEEKGLVESQLGEPTPERGGRRKRMYRTSRAGKQALDVTRAYVVRLWRNFLPA